jgi:hypothetical protein
VDMVRGERRLVLQSQCEMAETLLRPGGRVANRRLRPAKMAQSTVLGETLYVATGEPDDKAGANAVQAPGGGSSCASRDATRT